jgi:hypothetical protein
VEGTGFAPLELTASGKPELIKVRAQRDDELEQMVLLRFAWIFGLLRSVEYARRVRRHKIGPETIGAADHTVQQLEIVLIEERAAVVLFLIGGVILAYTFLNAPAFQ